MISVCKWDNFQVNIVIIGKFEIQLLMILFLPEFVIRDFHCW